MVATDGTSLSADARRRLLRHAVVVAVTSVVSLGALALFSYAFARDYDLAMNELSASAELRARADRMLQLLVDAETAQRGYVLTGDPAFLAPYEDARRELPGAAARLGEVSRARGLGPEHARIEDLVASRMSFTDDTVRLQRSGREAEARAAIAEGDGRRRTDAVRAALGEIVRAADARVESHRAHGALARERVLRVFAALVIVALLVAGYGFGLVRRELRAIDESARALEHAERRARESEARFRLLADRATDLIRIHDRDGRLLYASPSSEALLGRSPEELGRIDPLSLVPEVDRERLAGWLRDARVATPTEALVHRIVRRDGVVRWHATRLDVLRDRAGEVERLHVVSRDVTEQVEEQERQRVASGDLERLATRDELTGLLNRRGFQARAEPALVRATAQGRPVLLAFCDVNGLKTINDQLGHEAGDAVIRDTAQLVAATARGDDVVARLGGDEFVVLATVRDGESARAFHERLLARIRAHNADDGRPYRVSVSVGAALRAPDDTRSLDALLREADAAMYESKHARRGGGVTASGELLVRRRAEDGSSS